ncbi:MAG: hypothetical protein GEV13_16995 [Rhodospirillales bacterium]|nr:hypothetical protein [Rhodospirillales bacterium]
MLSDRDHGAGQLGHKDQGINKGSAEADHAEPDAHALEEADGLVGDDFSCWRDARSERVISARAVCSAAKKTSLACDASSTRLQVAHMSRPITPMINAVYIWQLSHVGCSLSFRPGRRKALEKSTGRQ